ncbi:fatty-acyl-CoA synthase [Rhodothalassium salexigens DSM 2132]|uniref:3-methylmercaptopropionyl-CoA ligase n=1 Tax=Rhodothalassium salexigens DSM 2132 TaxID=1188247 RepID=A0A4R2P796_RHOSA|nr:acyl-CoA synthetase [Rhodothalassium salexigens]MBB4212649.1 fatty-acyl-CoA synthase [Rhodothalassium salexigens DSM 2132]MBK1638737.1 acyl-CoA synthetase [Rhodothalassium salexigens DSM 2132]TCP30753.1 fatty-acyl-CoA synthase [Rhodothalassium salexigens DSM 2132]
MTNPFEADFLARQEANHVPLSPVDFLLRTAEAYPDRVAVIHGRQRFTYAQMLERVRRLASALKGRGIGPGSTVSVLAPNIPPHLEAHFAVPMTGAVLNSINYRLDAAAVGFILDHGECDALLVDGEFADLARAALGHAARSPLVIDLADPEGPDNRLVPMSYDDLLAEGDPHEEVWHIEDGWQAIALNYTSGTTGNPKGVVYHHRGAMLNAIGNVQAWDMGHDPVYLWTLPMFHCNGWCFPWGVTMQGGTHVCLRKVAAEPIINNIAEHGVTHMCGAPIVLNMIANAEETLRAKLPQGLRVLTAGAAPPPRVIEAMEDTGATITHGYGLTETYGPATVCAWHKEWDHLPLADRAALKARQGVRFMVLEGLDVMDPETMVPVPADGETLGEIVFRGNVVMKGYLKNPTATEEAFRGGWFHSGDLAVKHPDGYIEIRDRSKDIIISGGENISSIEVEGVLYQHPAVLEAAVVAKPDETWGETPCAFVTLKPGQTATEAEIVAFCRAEMAHFKAPRHIVFCDLPKTSTGKIQKFILRERAKEPVAAE